MGVWGGLSRLAADPPPGFSEQELDWQAHTKIEGPLAEIGARTFLGNSRSVDQAVASGGGSAYDLTPLVPAEAARVAWSVGCGAAEQWPGVRWGPTTFPGCQKVGGPSARALPTRDDPWTGWGKTP